MKNKILHFAGIAVLMMNSCTQEQNGNLWSEQPLYFQLYFAIDRVKKLAPEHPERKTEQPFKSVLEDDMAELMKLGTHGLLQLLWLRMQAIPLKNLKA